MLILVPWFGNVRKFAGLAEKWAKAYDASGCQVPFEFINEKCEWYVPHPEVIRENQPFDVKGDIVCSALEHWADEDLLVLDLDACVMRDPTYALSTISEAPIAMTLDHGAIIHWRDRMLQPPFDQVRKLNAGVMYFGKKGDAELSGIVRRLLVEDYRRSWKLMEPTLPWNPPLAHLLEQYAWAYVHYRMGGVFLPNVMNWSSRFLGQSKAAIIDHDYGLSKWRG